MKSYIMWTITYLKRLFKKPAFIVFLLIMPILSCLYIYGVSDKSSKIYVALYDMNNSELSNETIDRLLEYEGIFNFYEATSTDSIYEAVTKGDAHCGYIFTEDMAHLFETKKGKGSIDAIVSPSSSLASLIEEIIYSTIFDAFSKEIAYNYLIDNDIIDSANESESKEQIYKIYDYNLINFVDLVTEDNLDNYTEVISKDYIYNIPIKGVVALLIFISSLGGAYVYIRDRENGLFIKVAPYKRHLINIISIATPTIVTSLSGLIAIFIAHNNLSIFKEVFCLFLYFLIATAYVYLYNLVVKSSKLLCATIPIIIIACIVLSPIFIDVSSYIPQIRPISYLLPPTHYLNWF